MTELKGLQCNARYTHEFDRWLRVAVVGCGGQAIRNILPSLRFAPVELVALVDVDKSRAENIAVEYGVRRVYHDHRRLLDDGGVDALFFATGYDSSGVPLYPKQATDALAAGCHAWIEKPPAASVTDIEMLHLHAERAGLEVGVGFMKMFSPAVRKVVELVRESDFGAITSIYLRDPEQLPPREFRLDLIRMQWVLDHIVHPASVLHAIAGPLKRIFVEEEPGGGSVVTLKFVNGACGVLHQPWGQSGMCPKERLEVIGSGANVRVENNTRITYYRPGSPGEGDFVYGRTATYLSANHEAPLSWEMDAYSGQPLNANLFYQGYAPGIRYFCEQVLTGRPVEIGGLGDAWHVIRFFEALSQTTEENVYEIGEAPAWTISSRTTSGV